MLQYDRQGTRRMAQMDYFLQILAATSLGLVTSKGG
jgi:hypothetical protein